jgi:nucleotide-binding universal stress UspA family protein
MSPTPIATRQRWLIPVDGSEASLNAIRHAIRQATSDGARGETPAIEVLTVQVPLSNDISRFINAQTIDEFHREAGDQAQAAALKLLDEAGIGYQAHVLVGDIAPTIADFAHDQGCSQIIMGARGLGGLLGALLGSVTVKVVHLSSIPVLLVK